MGAPRWWWLLLAGRVAMGGAVMENCSWSKHLLKLDDVHLNSQTPFGAERRP